MLTGDGYVEFTAIDTTINVACGLNAVDANRTLHDLDYAIFLNDKTTGSLRIYEKGLLKKTVGTHVAGERFRVAVEGGSVNYHRVQNGVVVQPALYSSPAPTTPVVVDTSLFSPGSKITNVVISGAWSN